MSQAGAAMSIFLTPFFDVQGQLGVPLLWETVDWEWGLSFSGHLGKQTHTPPRQDLSLVSGYGSWNILS